MSIKYETIAKALFINYESLYDIDMSTGNYICFYQSEAYEKFEIEKQGTDFFGTLQEMVPRVIAPDDQEYVLERLSREALLDGTKNEEYYSFVYRVIRDGKAIYHKVRAKQDIDNGKVHIYLGIRDIDYLIRQERKHSEEIQSLLQKERNHMNAIMASAEGYLEINLTKDLVLERFTSCDGNKTKPLSLVPYMDELTKYSMLNQWVFDNLLATNHDTYKLVTRKEYLIEAFERGERRVSLDFCFKIGEKEQQPCKQVFHLYQDVASKDIMSFCVVYDLTEQQKKEKEREELERRLQMSRIRNFTGQMKPHFLYNALGSIQEIVLEDPQYAFDLLGDFTTYLRGCIRSMSNDKTVSFMQELDNIRAYVNVEKMRFGDKLLVDYDLQATDFEILPLSIQPLVENAIRHGIYQKGKMGGTVTIRTREDEDFWTIIIKDDGVGFDREKYLKAMEDEKSESTGLKNISFRLKEVLGAEINLETVIGEGTSVTVSIPKKGGNANENNDS